MQILFEESEEGGKDSLPGLGLIPGKIKRLPASILPQIGWNQVRASAGSKLFRGLVDQSFYFVHSYGLIKPPAEAEYATSDYQGEFVAAVEIGAISAVQFHPEKSGPAGLRLLANWAQTL
jgi:imidazole glycerol phosphate synthase glutamine amidotransferase subunit